MKNIHIKCCKSLFIYDIREISRTPGYPSIRELQDDEYGKLYAAGMHSSGRIILNLFRILRTEIKLTSYSFENCLFNILQKRLPRIPFNVLTEKFNQVINFEFVIYKCIVIVYIANVPSYY